jgi:peptidoglycan/xylan/chitin deacetylase (PgdA/CDA1 family)
VVVALLTAGLSVGVVQPSATAAAVPKTIISLTFDDGNADQFQAAQTLKANGLVGTFFITTSWIGSAGYLTRENLNSLAADGNEIGGHSVTHPDLTAVSSSTATAEICNGKATLESWGFRVSSFAYPFAAQKASLEKLVKNCGYTSARNLGDIRSPASCGSCPYAETIPPGNYYNTAAPDQVDSTWTLKNLQDFVTNAESHNGGWVQLTFHHIATKGDASLTIHPDLFNQFVTWLGARTANGTTVVQTVAQALGNTTLPPPAGNTKPAAPTNVTAVAGNSSATVSWTAPNNGGSVITSYTVTPYLGSTVQPATTVSGLNGVPPDTSTTVTSLTNGKGYTFKVSATNDVGQSAQSAPSAAVTPQAPTQTVVLNGGFESGLSSWTAGGISAPKAASRVHSGRGSALLGVSSGREPAGDSSLAQPITIPSSGSTSLSLWYQPNSDDRTCGGTTACQRDWMEGQVRSSTGATLQTLFKLNNDRGSWTRVTADLTPFKGQQVSLWFNVHLNGPNPNDNTWMYLDDVVVTTS